MNATEQVAKVRYAQAQVRTWDVETRNAVCAAIPQVARDHHVQERDWMVTVEVLRQSYETPVDAARRLAAYMRAHQERWDHTPSLNAIRRSV